jgi:hypothetical protein
MKILTKKNISYLIICSTGIFFVIIHHLNRHRSQPFSHNELQSRASFASEYSVDIKRIDDAWDSIRMGDQYYRDQDYDNAIRYYLLAYNKGGMTRGMSGILLAKSYAKSNQYNKALKILDQLDNEVFNKQNLEANELRAQIDSPRK